MNDENAIPDAIPDDVVATRLDGFLVDAAHGQATDPTWIAFRALERRVLDALARTRIHRFGLEGKHGVYVFDADATFTMLHVTFAPPESAVRRTARLDPDPDGGFFGSESAAHPVLSIAAKTRLYEWLLEPPMKDAR